jgi:hypothetical protein
MKIEILAPVFKCAEDESIFFSRLYSLPGYDSVVGKDRILYLILEDGSANVAINEVQEICDIWNTTYRVTD